MGIGVLIVALIIWLGRARWEDALKSQSDPTPAEEQASISESRGAAVETAAAPSALSESATAGGESETERQARLKAEKQQWMQKGDALRMLPRVSKEDPLLYRIAFLEWQVREGLRNESSIELWRKQLAVYQRTNPRWRAIKDLEEMLNNRAFTRQQKAEWLVKRTMTADEFAAWKTDQPASYG